MIAKFGMGIAAAPARTVPGFHRTTAGAEIHAASTARLTREFAGMVSGGPEFTSLGDLVQAVIAQSRSHYRNGGMARLMMRVPDATGIAVNFGKAIITARMISKSDPWGQFAAAPEFQGGAKTRKVDDGVWELSVSAQSQAGAMGVFALMGALGFVVLI